MLILSKRVHLLFDIVPHSLDFLDTYFRWADILPLVVRKEAYRLILLDQMRIILNKVQQDAVILLRFRIVVVLRCTFSVEYSSICVKSFPLDANILGQQIAGINVLVYHVDVVI